MGIGRYAVFGAGAVGGYFAGVMARAGFWVGVVARGETLRAIRESGLHLQTPHGAFDVRPATVTQDPSEIGPVDAVIVAVKAWQIPEAARSLKPLLGAETKALTLQNGIEASEQLQEIVGRRHALTGSCRILSEVMSPGRIRCGGGVQPTIVMGEPGDVQLTPASRRLEEALIASGVCVQTAPCIQLALWEKLMFLAPMSGVGAAARATAGEIRQCESTRQLLHQLMQEVVDVTIASGVVVGDDVISRSRALVESLPDHAIVSMHRDIVEGRPSELEEIIGAVIRFGRRCGVRTPATDFVYASLMPQERRARRARGPNAGDPNVDERCMPVQRTGWFEARSWS